MQDGVCGCVFSCPSPAVKTTALGEAGFPSGRGPACPGGVLFLSAFSDLRGSSVHLFCLPTSVRDK